MQKYAYGQRPSDIPAQRLALGWLRAVRHLQSRAATESYWHVHEEIQVLYRIKGETPYEFRERPSVVLTAGHLIVIPAGLEHRHLKAIDPAGHRVELLLAPSAAREATYGLFSESQARALAKALQEHACTPVACSRGLQGNFAELDALAVRGKSLSEAEVALARTLASLILQRCATQPQAAAGRPFEVRLMDETLAWLEAHYAEPIDIDRLVAYTGYSRSRLFDIFKEHTGLTPSDWISRRRIKEACLLLETTDQPTNAVARSCGFTSPQYFNAVFKRRTGTTPTEWRQRNG